MLSLVLAMQTADLSGLQTSVEFSWADILLNSDVVVLGRVTAFMPERRSRAPEPFGIPVLGGVVRVGVDSILLGTVENRSIDLCFFFPRSSPLSIGHRVVAWGTATGKRWGQVCGFVAVVAGGDTVQLGASLPCGGGDRHCWDVMPLQALLNELKSRRLQQAAEAFDGATAAMLARIGSSTARRHDMVLGLDSLDWFGAAAPKAPRFLPPLPECYQGPWPGDTLLIPVRESAPSDTLISSNCIAALVLRWGVVRVFRRNVADLADVLEVHEGPLRLRRVQSER
ncbi:MAG TPA: hypothetical protein VGK93_04365 [Candidatus Eisenbacteria bacterium]